MLLHSCCYRLLVTGLLQFCCYNSQPPLASCSVQRVVTVRPRAPTGRLYLKWGFNKNDVSAERKHWEISKSSGGPWKATNLSPPILVSNATWCLLLHNYPPPCRDFYSTKIHRHFVSCTPPPPPSRRVCYSITFHHHVLPSTPPLNTISSRLQ